MRAERIRGLLSVCGKNRRATIEEEKRGYCKADSYEMGGCKKSNKFGRTSILYLKVL
jgi:hypothetical protein